MPELPSREDVSASEDAPWRAYIPTYASWVLNDYADGVLLTRQEFVDSIEVNVGMIRAARDAQNEADRAVLDTDESDYTWWHIVLSAAIAAALREETT